MKLIREEIESVEFLVEQKNGKKSMYIEGVFLQGNIKNRNGRMYPMETLRREVARYNENHVVAGRALGELGHPDGPTVNLDRVSHKIVSLKESGSNFIGKAKILSTPMGKIASSLIEEGVKLGVSSRGIGSLKATREGVNIVGPLPMHLSKELWKEKSGFGMEVFSAKDMQRKLTKQSTL
jgi:hypothetical protein